LLTLVVALVSPLDAMGDALFSAHMTQHLLLILVAAPLLVLGEPVLPMLWAIPTAARRRGARWWRRATVLPAMAHALSHPSVAWVLHVGALLFWHIPAPYGWTVRHDAVHAVEHVSFLGTAMLFWWAVLQPTGRRRLSYAMSVLYVSTAGMLMGALGAILTFAPSPWYVAHLTTTAPWHVTPLEDQQLAGVIMWVPAGLVYLVAASVFFMKWLGPDTPRAADLQPIERPVRAHDIGMRIVARTRT
jgi:cytochrome c oxidase assembly factor CtaG